MRAKLLEEDEYGAYIIIKRLPPGPSIECAFTSTISRRNALLPLNNQPRSSSPCYISTSLVNYYRHIFSYCFSCSKHVF